MTSRKSSSAVEGLPSVRPGGRTPLRSLQNEMGLSTTSSRFKQRSLSNSDVFKTTKSDVRLYDPDHHTSCPPHNITDVCSPNLTVDRVPTIGTAATETAVGLGDVTFKSFICSGVEVEISDLPSIVAQDGIILPHDQPTENPCDTEDTVMTDSMMSHSSDNHMEHPYYYNDGNSASVDVCTGPLSEPSSTSEDSGNLDNCSGLVEDLFKSVICESVEVVVSDITTTRLSDETIPLPVPELGECLLHDTVDPSLIVDDCGEQCREEHADHPYWNSEGLELTSSTAPLDVFSGESACAEEPVRGTCDITFKSFVCTGGEIEVADYTMQADETIPVLIDEVMNSSNQPNDYSVNPSILVIDPNLQSNDDHKDHPYCNIENGSSSPSCGFSSFQEPLPGCHDDLNEMEPFNNMQLADGHIDRQEDVTFKPVTCAEGDVEVPHTADLAQENVPLSRSPSPPVILQQLPCNDGTLIGITMDHFDNRHRQVERDGAALDPGAISFTSSANTSLKLVNDPDLKCQIQETPKLHVDSSTVHSGHCSLENDGAVLDSNLSVVSAPPLVNALFNESVNNVNVNCPIQVTPKQASLHAVNSLLDNRELNCSVLGARGSLTPSLVQENLKHDIDMPSRSVALESSGANDSALGLSGNGQFPSNSLEKLCPENDDVLMSLPEIPSVPNTLQFEFMSPVIRGTPARLRIRRDSAFAQALAEESAMEEENSLVPPFLPVPYGPWLGPLESPMPRPLLNSTINGRRVSVMLQIAPIKEVVGDTNEKPSVAAPAQSAEEKPLVLDIPFIPNGPLQQQLRQMAEFLIMASGKMGASTTAVSAHSPPPPAAPESHSMCVGTSPVKMVDHSLNTSGQFERKREFSMADKCTITDPLLWNVPPGSLESLSKQELEQRLRSSMIMVEALVQQQTSARLHSSAASTGPAPSDLRDQMVQTEHTELSQTTTYRDLYIAALDRIGVLESDESSLQNLIQCIQDNRLTMTSLTSDTEAALANMNHMGEVVREDHKSLVTQYGQMRSLCAKVKESQTRMVQKVHDTLQEREDMRQQKEEAFTAKDAAFSVMEQLREHSAKQISQLEESLGSQKDLMAALTKTYPEQVALNKAYVESLNSASELLTSTTSDHTTLAEELQAARVLLQKSIPMLVKLNEKAAAALSERDQSLTQREQAEEAQEQVQEELDQANLNLQDATQQIADLKLQVTIMTSEMGVLHEKLGEGEEEQAMLERKVTDLNATVSSYMASFAFLEKGLGEQATKLQKSWEDAKQANGRADELEVSLSRSEQRVCELNQSLAHSEEQLRQLQTFSHSQSLQIEELKDVRTQFSIFKEENEFMQMENQLTREQVAETEASLRSHLQGLRERNIQCEDLKGALSHLQLERDELQTELEAARARTTAVQQELGGQLAQAGNDVTVFHHTLRGVTNDLHAALHEKKPEHCKDEGPQSSATAERRRPPVSFVDSIMKAMGTDTNMATPDDQDSPEVSEGLFSETSAFTRVPVTREEVKQVDPEVEEQSNVVMMLADMYNTVNELVSTLEQVKHHKNTQLLELHNTICGLQGELHTQTSSHQSKVEELEEQLRRLQSQLEKGNLALQQKAKDEKMITQLCTEINETRELLNQYKTDNTELRREVTELRLSLQQSQVESHALREELKKASSLSANPVHFMDEKIGLLQEVERLKRSLQEAEQARAKLLDRAKRHQIIHQANEQKLVKELQMLDTMLDKVRKTLLSVPEVVDSCEPLKQLVKYVC